jgi:hypothetical protein
MPVRGWDVPSTVTYQNDLGRMGSGASFVMIEYRRGDRKASISIITFANYSSIMSREMVKRRQVYKPQ